ncbi:C-GCAxxG-C-C family protein [[Clostridium] polysaccharolyticum]|uniref:C_GCAxxG_C_C family probable redox protein n=1 Tax=[Clostridium] polysaccharolyticum TaxID=29364 RepID=A0A1I0DI36_9FIRM|nr:C-GCAxxG-C-C family protein [[Clostridium] polysaccharolyticum]SET32132.1 C_GCAxxG_C_C family probable redox protein [[Clostridium] polysaccharolyticum]
MSVKTDKFVEIASKNHQSGYNCCQAVVCAFCKELGLDEDMAFRMAEGFGSGMGVQSTCGAVTGAIMLAGLKNSQGTDNVTTKGATYKMSKEIIAEFEKMNGSSICKELKGIETRQVLRSCSGCIEDAVRIAQKAVFASEE